MQRALDLVLALTQPRDEVALRDWLLETIQRVWQPHGVLLGMLNVSGRQLTCYGRVLDVPVSLQLAVDDFSRPLAYVLHKNQVRTWDSLYGGARIDHHDFRQMLCRVGPACGLHALPLLAENGKPLAVLALLDSSKRLLGLHHSGEGVRLGHVFCRQLMLLLRQLAITQREQTALRDSLRQIKNEDVHRRDREKQVEATLIGQSAATKTLHTQIYQAAHHRLSVLILGETGVGKDVVARLLHQCSDRADKPYIAINCAAIPENLVEITRRLSDKRAC
ncbi:sigma 54-interacting transcriptional regulator [Candidatus Symbiopectobacterium endolongispinus]|nr:hypothetical protein [Candidatus Symbiopectobacterium sp. PLON1]MBT9430235.1 sigma 54-interacting transcriptional regulator [Candidatus Symbiopectobacterium endolongispinus]